MVRAVRRKQACFLTTHTRIIHVPTDTKALMHLSMRCPTTPTSGVYWGNIGLLSRGLVHRGGAFVTRVLNDGHKSSQKSPVGMGRGMGDIWGRVGGGASH